MVIQRSHGYRFINYTLDHEPAHVHVVGAGVAKINLLGPGDAASIVYRIGLKRPDMRRLMNEVSDRREAFLREWDRIHGSHH